MSVEIGQMAPDFTLKNQHGEEVTLSDLRGKKNVVLVFYPMAFTGICTGELCEIRDNLNVYANDDAAVFGISCDTPASLRVFAEQEGIEFPLLSDFWPHGKVAQEYGSFLAERGIALRGTFVIDKDGIVRWSVVNAPGDARNAADVHTAIASL